MKKTLLALLTVLLTGFNAVAQNAKDVAGSYTGTIYISLMAPIDENTEGLENRTISITADSESTVKLGIYDLDLGTAEEPMPMGDIILPNLPLVSKGTSYLFGETDPVHLTILGAIEATAGVNTTTSYIRDGKAYLDIDVTWDNAGELVPIYVRFVSSEPMKADIAPTVEKNYKGSIFISLMEPINDNTEALTDREVSIVADAANSITLSIYNLDLGDADEPMPMGDIVLPRQPIMQAEDGSIRFGKTDPVHLTILGAIEAEATVNTETSYFKDGMAYFDINVTWDNAGESVPIYVRFKDNSIINSISGVTTAPVAAKGIYTLNGIRLNTLDGATKGVYIKDGKKVLVK